MRTHMGIVKQCVCIVKQSHIRMYTQMRAHIARMHACTHACKHARMHARTHAHLFSNTPLGGRAVYHAEVKSVTAPSATPSTPPFDTPLRHPPFDTPFHLAAAGLWQGCDGGYGGHITGCTPAMSRVSRAAVRDASCMAVDEAAAWPTIEMYVYTVTCG